jgi:predicted flap endonuclease-1-like 5' DNA nuclease
VHTIGEVEDIDAGNEAKLNGLGIRTTDDFLARAATPGGRSELATAVGVTDKDILKWANCADLMRVEGIGMQFADLLEEAGVETIPELAQRNASNLHARVVEVNTERKLSGRAPTAQEVENWVSQAKALPRILNYGGSGDTSSATAGTTASMPSTSSPSSSTASSPAASADAPTSSMPSASMPSAPSSSSETSSSDTSSSATMPSAATTSDAGTMAESAADSAQDAASTAADSAQDAASTAADSASSAAGSASSAASSSIGSASSAADTGTGFLQRLMNRLRGRG